MRLFDDLPMLKHTLEYGLGKNVIEHLCKYCINVLSTRISFQKLSLTFTYLFLIQEPDRVFSFLGVLGNVVDQLFFPIEKVCWFGECGVIKLTDKQMNLFDTINTVFWATSLYITLLRYLTDIKIHYAIHFNF